MSHTSQNRNYIPTQRFNKRGSEVKIFNYKTQEELSFPSISACSRHLNLPYETVLRWIHEKSDYLLHGLQIKYKHDHTPWKMFKEDPATIVSNSRRSRWSIVLNMVLTNENKTFANLEEVALFLGVTRVALRDLSRQDKNFVHVIKNQYFRYQRYRKYTPWIPVDDIYKTLALQGRIIPCCYNDHDVKVFLSCKDCCDDRKVTRQTLSIRLKSDFKTVYRDGYRYGHYLDYLKLKEDTSV
nr:MAG TPA: NUMOD1 domain protein [Caudoviricetes sp.]